MGKDGCKHELNALKEGLKSLIHCSIRKGSPRREMYFFIYIHAYLRFIFKLIKTKVIIQIIQKICEVKLSFLPHIACSFLSVLAKMFLGVNYYISVYIYIYIR